MTPLRPNAHFARPGTRTHARSHGQSLAGTRRGARAEARAVPAPRGRALWLIGAGLALAGALWAAPLPAQEAGAEATRQIRVTGEGRSEAAPDMAILSVGVVAEGDSAAEAMSAASEKAAAILARMEALGIAARDVQTSELRLSPIWSDRGPRPVEGETPERPRILGFTAQTQVTLRQRDLEALGPLLDAVVSDGANQFGGLRFALQNPDAAEAEARADAVADAMARARQLAQAAGVTLGPVQSIAEAGSHGGPVHMEMAAMARDSAMPVAPGELTVESRVEMVFAISD